MPLNPGSRLGIFEIIAPLGVGGMGEVYRAKDTVLERDVAIKVLPDSLARDAERLARFQREAKVLASLNHPNIGHIYGVESQALVMELVEGARLQGPLAVETALNYARQIAEALEVAHERGIVHRDLKPANIMVTHDGVVKVLDFGLAKAANSVGNTEAGDSATRTIENTAEGVILGTAAYMSPEQARGASVDRRADIWAFGAVLYEMLTGKPAFAGSTVTDILAAVLRSEPDWSALPASTPPRIRRLLRRCLEPDRKQRLQAIGEARIAIDAPEQEAAQRPAPARRSWPWVAAVAVVGMAGLAVGMWRSGGARAPAQLMRLRVEMSPDTKMERPDSGGFFALSTDGTMLAVVTRGSDGKIRLATRRMDQNQLTPLAGTDGGVSPVFSPDGQWIAFNADRKIKKIAVGGGPVVTLCDSPGRMTSSWTADGNLIAPLGWNSGLSRIPGAGGAPVPLTKLDAGKEERRHGWPQVLPGDRAVLFTTQHTGQSFDDADIDIVLKTGERKNLHHGGFFARYLPSGHLVWLHENALYAAPFDLNRLTLSGEAQPVLEDIHVSEGMGGDFSFSQNGTVVYGSGSGELKQSIFWMDSSGRTSPLHSTPGTYNYLRFSPDGKRLAFTVSDSPSHQDIWVRDLERDAAARVTLLTGQNWPPIWTPDSKTLFFWSANQAAPGIYSVSADGSGVAQRLTDGSIQQVPWAISPDGKHLALDRPTAAAAIEVWMTDIEGDTAHPRLGKSEPFVRTQFSAISAEFSPDGQWLAYYSHDPEKEGVWVTRFPGPGGSWLVSARGDEPIWSRSGHELFFTEASHTIMFAKYTSKGDAFLFDKPQAWTTHRLLDLGTFDLAPDGKRVAVILNADGTTEKKPVTHLTFLVNFFDELRRRVPTKR